LVSVLPSTSEVGRHALDLRDLEARLGAAQDEGEPRVVVDDVGGLGKRMPLVGRIVDRIRRRRGVLDADVVVQELAGNDQSLLPLLPP